MKDDASETGREPFPVFLVLAMAIAISTVSSAMGPRPQGFFTELVVMNALEVPGAPAFLGVAFVAGMVAGFALLRHRGWTQWLRAPAVGLASFLAMMCLLFVFHLFETEDMLGRGTYGVGGLVIDAIGWVMMMAIPGGLALLVFIPAVRPPRVI
jgi:hypothetical protein